MLVYGHDEIVAQWVAAKLRQPPYARGMARAIGITDNNILIAGVVYNNQHLDNHGKPLLIEMSIASVDKHWCTRHNLKELFSYPFLQLRVKRVQATCHRRAKHVRSFLDRLGFHFEGIVREAHPLGGDAAHYSMLKPECKWIKNGEIITKSASHTRPGNNGCRANQI